MHDMKSAKGKEEKAIQRSNSKFNTCETTLLSADEIVATYVLRYGTHKKVAARESVILNIVSWNTSIIALLINVIDQNTRTTKPLASSESTITSTAKL